ncbi:hypothetical protein FEM03_20780 [Phragmitibacter flavus]|uniref:Uncharacterized protein n=2 Tax=Phragmitibacter flavus TaxID=2576071 RepID=A0A5R8K8W5_9BACT|nr:hypothetical protein FEM03_20780 [Phragmitibacter flavus]
MFLRPGHLFGFGHEPIFIPWCEFYQARRKKFLLSNLVSVNIGSPKVAEITLAAQVFEQSEGAKVLN